MRIDFNEIVGATGMEFKELVALLNKPFTASSGNVARMKIMGITKNAEPSIGMVSWEKQQSKEDEAEFETWIEGLVDEQKNDR